MKRSVLFIFAAFVIGLWPISAYAVTQCTLYSVNLGAQDACGGGTATCWRLSCSDGTNKAACECDLYARNRPNTLTPNIQYGILGRESIIINGKVIYLNRISWKEVTATTNEFPRKTRQDTYHPGM
jgi:hypothetical protein